MLSMDQFWSDFTYYLREILADQTYQSWVVPVKIAELGKQSLTILVPNEVTKKYWERHLAGYILQYSLEKYGKEYHPEFLVIPPEVQADINQEDIIDLDSPQLSDSPLNPKYTFENFVVGEGNKMAGGAAMAVVDGPGVTYNPFLIYGGVGLGKTHLMQAIGNEIKARNPRVKIKYATSETFVNDFITSIQTNSQQEFRDSYRNVDILLIDDIQFLSSKDKTQEEFFHTFNALYNNGKQIVLTSDRLPNNIDNLEERLISRFKWGLSTDITPPDLETRIAILRKKAASENLDVPSDALTYIANNVDTNIRELEGALVRVIAYAAIHGQDITSSLAADALQSIVDEQSDRPVTVDEIIKHIANYYNITVDDIKGKRRTKNIVNPRQIAMYMSRELTDLSFPKIGEKFGNKNHTTVIHAYDKISSEMQDNMQLKQEVSQLMNYFQK